MEIMEFCNKVKKNMMAYVGEETRVDVKRITKNNGIILHSIIVTEKEKNISPNIYLDDLYEAYEKGETFRSVMEEIVQIYRDSKRKKNMDMSFFLDYDSMKERVVYKIISYEKNKELLLQVPYIPFLDLAIVFYCYVPQKEFGSATILIYNNHLKMWKITKERLLQDAERNTERIMPARILSIEEMMKEVFAQELSAESPEKQVEEDWLLSADKNGSGEDGRMYVLGNNMKLFGAASMLYKGLVENFADKIGKNLFILPSSIHEVILVPDNGDMEARELWEMVCEINATQVEPEEVLTDSVYYFSRKFKKIERLF